MSSPSIPGGLPTDHRDRLQWFADRPGQVVTWAELSAVRPRLVTAAKGIYKPEGSAYAVSIRQTIGSPYADRAPVTRASGGWLYAYHAELGRGRSTELFTNRALDACRRDMIPVGVLRQVSAVPVARYTVDGLAQVADYDGSFFILADGGASDGDLRRAAVAYAEGSAVVNAAALNAVETGDLVDARERVLAAIVRRRGQPTFRAMLLRAYEGRCAVSGCDVEAVLEAAHIIPYLGPETNTAGNGLLLRADLHTLFDLGLIAVEPQSRSIRVADALRATEYGALNGRPIREPIAPTYRPQAGALAHHITRSHIAV